MDTALDVLVISPYTRQVAELRSKIHGLKAPHLKIDVQTVDAVQSRECDLAIFSVTRSDPNGRLGFLGQPYWRRINVALSRARYGLTIVGDSRFCRRASKSPGSLDARRACRHSFVCRRVTGGEGTLGRHQAMRWVSPTVTCPSSAAAHPPRDPAAVLLAQGCCRPSST
ncbi:AAA domain-containing protein [Streptosporangium subroseum]|uniref:AAA domain-containing protein n=1 Tax=Streptosporangium subroseum TaxID=106412 RepID=UPI00352C6A66